MKYKSEKEAIEDHVKNYRSDGIRKGKGTKYSSDFHRVQFIIASVPRKAHVLDVGCNSGVVAVRLQALGCYVNGLDVVEELVEKAKGHGVMAELGNAEDLSRYKKGTFDAVVCAEVLEHLYDPLVAIKEAYRVLKKGGRYIVTVPHIDGEMCEGKLGDYHQQNFSFEILNTLFHSVFKKDNVKFVSIPYVEEYSRVNGKDPKRPQWVGLVATK